MAKSEPIRIHVETLTSFTLTAVGEPDAKLLERLRALLGDDPAVPLTTMLELYERHVGKSRRAA